MNTTGIQNYLSNVFHPIYTYDTTSANFTPKLTMSNIYNYTGNTLSVFTAAVGDVNSNVYVGSNAGNPYDITRNVFNVTALGYGAASNISNDSNSVYIGWYAGSSGSNSANVISIGANSGGNGAENIFIGTETGSVGTSNVLIGHFIDVGSSSNQLRIGYRNKIPIAADVSKNWVGLGGVLSPTYTYNTLDVSGNAVFTGNVGINKDVSSSSPAGNRTLDVNGNFRASDSSTNILDFKDGITRSSKGFATDMSTVTLAINGTVDIGTLRRGITALTVSALTGGAYNSRFITYNDNYSVVGVVGSATNGTAPAFNFTGSNTIQLSNGTGASNTFSWSVTYFPSP
jgi:hypothetical protein